MQKSKLHQELRYHVTDQIEKYRLQQFKPKGWHVHHVIPFKKLVDDWLYWNDIDPDTIILNQETILNFQNYHRYNAKLKMISEKEHKALHSKEKQEDISWPEMVERLKEETINDLKSKMEYTRSTRNDPK